MVVRTLFYILLSIIIILLQTVYIDVIPLFGVKPNLFIVALICIALTRPKQEIIPISIFLGFVLDVISAKWIGFYVFLSLGLVLVAVWFNTRLFRESTFVTSLLTFIATLLFELIVYLVLIFPNQNEAFLYVFRFVIVPEAILNALISVFMIRIFRKNSLFFQNTNELRKY